MKNLPQRERAKRRSHSNYCRHDKAPYQYPSWVTDPTRHAVPATVLKAMPYPYRPGYYEEEANPDVIKP